mmetsp:Transcript_65999/g.148941  ORF Transcript_65999/g.148941 Transcript_65999/m.148941 type:complete len:267 (+) Transcript_65999:36-836(+)
MASIIDSREKRLEALDSMGPDIYGYRDPFKDLLRNARADPVRAAEEAESCERREVERAAEAIAKADYLVVLAGAGLGVDSGLATYGDIARVAAWRAKGLDYGDLCLPALLEEDPACALGFWASCSNAYADSTPHRGYEILLKWCRAKRAKRGHEKGGQEKERPAARDRDPRLQEGGVAVGETEAGPGVGAGAQVEKGASPSQPAQPPAQPPAPSVDSCRGVSGSRAEAPGGAPVGAWGGGDYFVYTSNVDGHFRRVGFDPGTRALK